MAIFSVRLPQTEKNMTNGGKWRLNEVIRLGYLKNQFKFKVKAEFEEKRPK